MAPNVESDENVVKKFPYKILNDLAKKLKAAEEQIIEERKFYEAKDIEICQLKQTIADLAYENNRYHLALSYCTVCTSDDEFSDAYLSDEVSIKASTPVSISLDTLEPSISPVPPLMPCSVVKGKQTHSDVKRKDKAFINRMMKTLAKLETKYQVPEHKRKKRLFARKQKRSSIIP